MAALPSLAVAPADALAATYRSDYGQSRTHNITVEPDTHNFEINGIAARRNTEWYVDGVYTGTAENDYSGIFAIDPQYTHLLSAGASVIEGVVYDRFWNYEETHRWSVVVGQADLIVEQIFTFAPIALTVGEPATILFRICNRGDAGTGPGGIRVDYLLDGSFFGSRTLPGLSGAIVKSR